MLVLSRKLNQKVYIGPDVCVTIVGIDRGKIRLGISAPKEVVIYREEIMTEEQLEARRRAVDENER